MKTWKAIQIGCTVALGLAMYMPAARADIRNQEVYVTFGKPMQVSDSVILPAGTYSFRLADGLSKPQNMVQIFDDQGSHVANVETEAVDRGVGPQRTLGNKDYRNFEETKLQFVQGS